MEPLINFIEDFVIEHIDYSKGLKYYRDNRVTFLNNKKVDASWHLSFRVLGSSVYQIEILIKGDPKRDSYKLIEKCNCPAFEKYGTCKHIAASLIWLTKSSYAPSLESQQNDLDIEKKPVSKEYLVKNLSLKPVPLNFHHVEDFHLSNSKVLALRSEKSNNFSHEVEFKFPISIGKGKDVPKKGIVHYKILKNDLFISCTCGISNSKLLCHHAYSSMVWLNNYRFSFYFLEGHPIWEETNKQAEKELSDYKLPTNKNWREYFDIEIYADGVKFLPKGNISDRLQISKAQIASFFKPKSFEKELPANEDIHKENLYEYGFYFRKATGRESLPIIFQPFLGKRSKRNDEFEVNFKTIDKLGWNERIDIKAEDYKLLELANKFKHGLKRQAKEDINYLLWIQEMSSDLEDHTKIYYNLSESDYYVSKNNLVKINFKVAQLQLRYLLQKENDDIRIKIELQDQLSDLSLENSSFFHWAPHFLLANSNMYFLPSVADTELFFVAQEINGKKIHVSQFEQFYESHLQYVAGKHQIDFEGFENLNLDINQMEPLGREIYLDEWNDHVVIKPTVRYSEHELVDILAETDIWHFENESIKIKKGSEVYHKNFIDKIKSLHPALKNQFRNDFFHLKYQQFLEKDFYVTFFDALEKEGIKVFGSKNLSKLAQMPKKGIVSITVSSGIDWFSVEGNVNFGEEKYNLSQLKKLFTPGKDYIELKSGAKGIIPAEWVKKLEGIFKHAENEEENLKISKKLFSVIDILFGYIDDTALQQELEEKRQKLLNFDQMSTYSLPENKNATLRHYQEDGFQWLCFLDEFQWGGILADDMGLGKTLQIITFLKHLLKKSRDTNLIIVPTSLLFNWQNELKKFAPEINAYFHYGNSRNKNIKNFEDFDLVISSYGTAMSDIEILKQHRFNYIILDESQAIKNPSSKRYKAMRLLQGNNRLAMTGTPIENNTFDLFAQMNFLNPGMLGSMASFKKDFSNPIDNRKDTETAQYLQKLIKPFILRRTKEQVAKELPDKIEDIIYCEMESSQRRIYENTRKQIIEGLKNTFEEKGFEKSKIMVLEGLTRLRLICDSPILVDKIETPTNVSVKLDTLLEHIEEKTANHKILVFSQFVKMLSLVESALQDRKIKYAYLDGQTATKNREIEVGKFQDDENCRVFLLSLKAGGTGLNLTAADYVYIIDPWWNPAVENQAIDRCYRIGQDKKVIAYRMVCKDTIEEKILELQNKKKAIAKEIISTDDSIMKQLSKNDIIDLFS